jgi:GDP-mannose 6-dehydrogenase
MSDSQMKRVGVYGLGYVGCVSAACLASRGWQVVGVDVNPDKVESVRQGRSPVVEEISGTTAHRF